jgi:hypothetical protein
MRCAHHPAPAACSTPSSAESITFDSGVCNVRPIEFRLQVVASDLEGDRSLPAEHVHVHNRIHAARLSPLWILRRWRSIVFIWSLWRGGHRLRTVASRIVVVWACGKRRTRYIQTSVHACVLVVVLRTAQRKSDVREVMLEKQSGSCARQPHVADLRRGGTGVLRMSTVNGAEAAVTYYRELVCSFVICCSACINMRWCMVRVLRSCRGVHRSLPVQPGDFPRASIVREKRTACVWFRFVVFDCVAMRMLHSVRRVRRSLLVHS